LGFNNVLRTILRVIGVAGLLGILVAILVGGEQPLSAGTPAPPVNAKALDGALVDVGLKSGGVTVVNIWGTWCPPCRAELPELVDEAHKYQGKVRFIGLAVSSSDKDIAMLVERMRIPYDIAHIDDVTADAWNATSVPDTYIVDGDGVVRWSVRGQVDAKLLDEKLAPYLR
jgi:thiol-disulfide isomerase/thioredoxin